MPQNLPHFTDSIFYSIEQIARYLEINAKAFFEKISKELTPEEFRTIDVILCNPDICQRDLAKLILRDRVRTGRILDSLELKGMIKRFGDLKNNRLVKKMALTEKGLLCFNEITKKLQVYMAETSKEFTPKQMEELRSLLNLLKKVLTDVTKVPV